MLKFFPPAVYRAQLPFVHGGSTISSEQILSATPSSSYFSCAPVWVFSMHCNPSRGVCSSTSSPQALVKECPFGQACCPIKTAMWVSAPVWSSLCWRGTTCFSLFFSMSFKEISALAHGAPHHLPFPLTLGCLSLLFFIQPLFCESFESFLHTVSQSCHWYQWRVRLCPAVSL